MNRRTILKAGAALAASSNSSISTAAATADENPYERIRRLSNELSEALVDVPQYEYVMVRPDKDEYPVLIAYRGPSSAEAMAKVHFSEYRRAMQMIDPSIKGWSVYHPIDDDDCRVMITASSKPIKK
jgi:hypothetical protein